MNEERYWEAVLAREATADGAFVYAVRSTGMAASLIRRTPR